MNTDLVSLKPNPYSEFFRICAYCGEPFMSNHQLRKFCPQKNGIPNSCKNKYKVLHATADLVKPDSNELLFDSYTIVEDRKVPITTLHCLNKSLSKEEQDRRTENINCLTQLLNGKKECEVELEEFDKIGYDIKIYDFVRQITQTNLNRIEIGPYALFWTKKNKFQITLISEILWM